MTYEEIVRDVEEASGKAVLSRIVDSDPRERQLPIRHHESGAIMAYVQEADADGLQPVVLNGLVVGYYRDTPSGRIRPLFHDDKVSRFVYSGPGEEWANRFAAYGKPKGSFLVRRTPLRSASSGGLR